MTVLSTNTAALTLGKAAVTFILNAVRALRPTPKTPEQQLASEQRQAEARARVDHLLR